MEVKFPRSFARSPSYYLNQPIPVVPLITWQSLIFLPTPGRNTHKHMPTRIHTLSLFYLHARVPRTQQPNGDDLLNPSTLAQPLDTHF